MKESKNKLKHNYGCEVVKIEPSCPNVVLEMVKITVNVKYILNIIQFGSRPRDLTNNGVVKLVFGYLTCLDACQLHVHIFHRRITVAIYHGLISSTKKSVSFEFKFWKSARCTM